jgi:hypothetical protein
MDPLYFFSVGEADCFIKRIKGLNKKCKKIIFCDQLYPPGEWKYNYNYWTGGFKYNESDIPQWTMDNSTIDDAVITWALDKKPQFNCLHYKINDTNGNRSVSWSFKNCSSKFVAACRVHIFLLCS